MATSTYLSIITLSINGLNALIKRHREANWIKINKKNKNKTLQYAAKGRIKITWLSQ